MEEFILEYMTGSFASSLRVDTAAVRRVANIATGALVEFDVALCFH